jgi:O-antigen biosynthesis protein
MTSGPLRFPQCDAPQVTVAMAVHDAPEWTARSLSALIEHTPPIYEVSIVDDGSRDPAARELLDGLEGARVVRNTESTGFGPASNLAAAGCRGDLVLYLNSDVVVSEGWIQPLLERIAEDGVGAVAPMLLNGDGTLQQAAAIIGRDGGTDIYGIGEDPSAAPYTFSRIVDYAAAACLLVRRELVERSGGFDAHFAPAYFEDADLCLRLATDGWNTVYEPRSRVVHGWGASYGAEPSPIAQRNRDRFEKRWRDILRTRPSTLDRGRPWTLLAARDARVDARILVLDHARDLDVSLLAQAFPRARITAVGPGRTVSGIIEVETIDPDEAEVPLLLGERRFHYDAVVVLGHSAIRVAEALATWQPHAVLVRAPADEVVSRLRAAGF